MVAKVLVWRYDDRSGYGAVRVYLEGDYDKKEGTVTYGFKLTPEELSKINETGVIFLKQFTGGHLMQPILPTVFKEDVITPEG